MPSSTIPRLRLVLSGLVLTMPLIAHAGGSLMAAEGKSTLIRASGPVKGESGAVLTAGDRLRTASNARLQLWMQDDTMIVLGADSDLQLSAYSPESRSAEYRLTSGSIRMLTGAFSSRLQTDVATIAPVGTDFMAVVCAAQCGDNPAGLYVNVSAGRVDVSNQQGSLQVGAGQLVHVADASTAPRLVNTAGEELPLLMARLQIVSEPINANVEARVPPVGSGALLFPGPVPTITPAPTATPVPTASPGPTPGPTASPAPTPSPTVSPGPTPSPTVSPGPTPSPTVSPTPVPTPEPTPVDPDPSPSSP